MNRTLSVSIIIFSVLSLLSCEKKDEDALSAATQEGSLQEKEPIAVETEPVRSEPFVQGIEASGIVEGIREADVISETSGIIREVFFEIGRYAEKGSLLLTVENDTALSNLNFARQDRKTAELEFEAVQQSYKTGGTSLVAYNQALTRLEKSRLQYEQARDSFENTEIRAPFAGYLSARDSSVSVGSYLTAGASVTHLVDTASFRIRLSVGEEDITRIRIGSPALVSINALPGPSTEALVEAVSPGSRRSGGSFTVIVGWENRTKDRIKSGMSARVVLLPDSRSRKELIVPSGAIVYRNGLPYVFRVREETAEAVEVVIDRILGNRASLKSGVSEGDQLILSGLNSLVPGDPVLAVPAGEQGTPP